MRRRVLFAVMALATMFADGCGYSLRPPFDPTIRTVYVPVFKSVSFRRDLNFQLTELVQKEIDRRAGFKVVGTSEEADSILEGTLVYADKNIIVENPNNLPRELMSMLTVEVNWIDNRSPEARETTRKRPPVRVIRNLPFFSEIGETTNIAFQKGLQEVARDIVNMMEQPW